MSKRLQFLYEIMHIQGFMNQLPQSKSGLTAPWLKLEQQLLLQIAKERIWSDLTQ